MAQEGLSRVFRGRNCLPNPCLRQGLGLYRGGLGIICRNASTFTFPRLGILIGHSHVRGEVESARPIHHEFNNGGIRKLLEFDLLSSCEPNPADKRVYD